MEAIKEKLTNLLKDLIEIESEIDEQLGFFDMGLTSLTILSFCEKINEAFQINCDESDIFNYPNMSELSKFVYQKNMKI